MSTGREGREKLSACVCCHISILFKIVYKRDKVKVAMTKGERMVNEKGHAKRKKN